MTGDELEARMTVDELLEWRERFIMQAEQQKKSMAEAKAKAKAGRRR